MTKIRELIESYRQDIMRSAIKQMKKIPYWYSMYGDGRPGTLHIICPECFLTHELKNDEKRLDVDPDKQWGTGDKWCYEIVNNKKMIMTNLFHCQNHVLEVIYDEDKNYVRVYYEDK